jgi:hypothetical protein
MIVIIRAKADGQTLKKIAEDFQGYVKVVVDVPKEILAAGGKKHSDAEEIMLGDGSRQEDLWGGGIDLETGEVDFDSMINIRPRQGNASREVLDRTIRQKMEKIIRGLIR